MSYQPFWQRPSWTEIILPTFKAGNYYQTFLSLMNRMPELFYPPTEQDYDSSVAKYGQETWYAPHNLFRELFHFIGGFAIAAPLGWINLPYFNYAILAAVFGTFFYIDFIVDIPQGKQWQKATLDVLFWVSGAATGLALYLL